MQPIVERGVGQIRDPSQLRPSRRLPQRQAARTARQGQSQQRPRVRHAPPPPPGNAYWQRDLAVSLGRIGDVQQTQGDLAAALASYQASLAIAERLAKTDPGNAYWQREFSVSHGKIGDVQQAQGDLAAALASYQASLAIAEHLAKTDPGNAGWQRDLWVSHVNIGDVQQKQDDLAAALASHQASLAIAERLAKAHHGNAGGQRDLAVSHEKIGEVEQAQGDLAAALASHQASHAIFGCGAACKSRPSEGVIGDRGETGPEPTASASSSRAIDIMGIRSIWTLRFLGGQKRGFPFFTLAHAGRMQSIKRMHLGKGSPKFDRHCDAGSCRDREDCEISGGRSWTAEGIADVGLGSSDRQPSIARASLD